MGLPARRSINEDASAGFGEVTRSSLVTIGPAETAATRAVKMEADVANFMIVVGFGLAITVLDIGVPEDSRWNFVVGKEDVSLFLE